MFISDTVDPISEWDEINFNFLAMYEQNVLKVQPVLTMLFNVLKLNVFSELG